MENQFKREKKTKHKWWFFVILIAFIILIPLWVYLIANWSWLGLSNKNNEIGDALGGITNPIIGIGGIVLTFLAFYVQYQFNQEQSIRIDLETQERIEDKKKSDKERSFTFLSNEFLRIEDKLLKNTITLNSLRNLKIEYNSKNDFKNIIINLNYSITLLNNLIRQIDLRRVIDFRLKNIFLDKDDQILLSNIYFLYTVALDDSLTIFIITLERFMDKGYISDEIYYLRNKSEIKELHDNIKKIDEILFSINSIYD